MRSSNEDLRRRGFITKDDFDVLNSNDEAKISEVIDAIGFLLFYNRNYSSKYFYDSIINTLNKYSENNLITWKCICCLSSFRTQSSIEVLKKVLNNSENYIIKCEAKRSLKLIGDI